MHTAFSPHKARIWLLFAFLVSPFLDAPAEAASRHKGAVTFVATKTIYLRFPTHTFRVGDTLQLHRKGQPLGTWKIIATTSKTVSAQHLSGKNEAKKGDTAQGTGSRVERAETASSQAKNLTSATKKQLWLEVQPSIGTPVSFRGQDLLAPANAYTRIAYDVSLQYLGVFARGTSFQTALLQSRMELSNILGSGFWHRHLVRVRYDFSDPGDPWQGKYRPNLEVYQLSAGYRFRLFDIGVGRLSHIPSEIGLVDGIKFQADPLPQLSLIVYGGLAPDERSLLPRLAGIRYGATVQINPWGRHRFSRIGFAGQLEQGQLDRHLLFAHTEWSPTDWLDLFARGVVEVIVPDNTVGRTAPEVSSLTADAKLNPLSWLSIGARYDAFRPALNLNWLLAWKENLPAEVFQEYFTEELRHSARLSVTLQHNRAAIRGGVSADYLYQQEHSFAATGWFHWYRIKGMPLRLYGRYSFLRNPFIQQGHQASVRIGGTIANQVELATGYRVAAYFATQNEWELEHTVKADLHWLLPLGFSVLVSGQVRFGEIDRSIFVMSQLRWRFDRP